VIGYGCRLLWRFFRKNEIMLKNEKNAQKEGSSLSLCIIGDRIWMPSFMAFFSFF